MEEYNEYTDDAVDLMMEDFELGQDMYVPYNGFDGYDLQAAQENFENEFYASVYTESDEFYNLVTSYLTP